MDKVKNYFKEKKIDARFATAGPGKKLGSQNGDKKIEKIPTFGGQPLLNKNETHGPHSSQSQCQDTPCSSNSALVQDKKIYFRCPHLDTDLSLPRDQMLERVREYLYTNLPSDPVYFSTLIIKTLNSPGRAQNAVTVMAKYIENLRRDPSNPTYRRIRCANKIFSERVRPLEGTLEFLNALGFVVKMGTREAQNLSNAERDPDSSGPVISVPIERVGTDNTVSGAEGANREEEEEEFLHIPPTEDKDPNSSDVANSLHPENLEAAHDILTKARGLDLVLDRDVRVYHFVSSVPRLEPPDDFFQRSLEEFKRDYARSRARSELESRLRTRAMREADDGCRPNQERPYTFVRVKFPRNVILQGTFGADEPFGSVVDFVTDHVTVVTRSRDDEPALPFNLITSWGEKLLGGPVGGGSGGTTTKDVAGKPSKRNTKNVEMTLRQLKLVPTALLIFHPNEPPIISTGGRNNEASGSVTLVAKADFDTYLNGTALAKLKIV